MPWEDVWETFFDPHAVLEKLELTVDCRCVVDFGCGYGTFALPAARMIAGTVFALDIDPQMIAATKVRAHAAQLRNWQANQRDFLTQGCGLPEGAADYAMLFNILHAAEAPELLAEAWRVLRAGGRLGVMHWNYDSSTPRGPSMAIRLRPNDCRRLVENAGFSIQQVIDLPPYHYGLVGVRTA